MALHRVNRTDRSATTPFETAHNAFHMSLLTRCRSPILLKFCEQLYDLNIRYRYGASQSPNYQQRDSAEEHDQILSAAIEGDAVKASETLLLHYRTTGRFLVEQLSARA